MNEKKMEILIKNDNKLKMHSDDAQIQNYLLENS